MPTKWTVTNVLFSNSLSSSYGLTVFTDYKVTD